MTKFKGIELTIELPNFGPLRFCLPEVEATFWRLSFPNHRPRIKVKSHFRVYGIGKIFIYSTVPLNVLPDIRPKWTDNESLDASITEQKKERLTGCPVKSVSIEYVPLSDRL